MESTKADPIKSKKESDAKALVHVEANHLKSLGGYIKAQNQGRASERESEPNWVVDDIFFDVVARDFFAANL